MSKNNKATKIGICLVAELLIVVFSIMFIASFYGKYGSDIKTTTTFEDGVPSQKVYSCPITVKKSGNYVLSGGWGGTTFDSTPKYITGFVLRAPDDSVQMAFTAGILYFDSPIKLQKGTYKLEYHVIADLDSYNEFIRKYDVKGQDYPLNELPKIEVMKGYNGSFDMQYKINIDRSDFFYGISAVIIGMLVMTPIIIMLFIAVSTDGELKSKVDERQERVNSKAASLGFFVAVAEMVLFADYQMVVDASGARLPIQSGVIAFALVVIAICVFTTYSILHDGYFALNINKTWTIVVQAVLAVILLALGVYYIVKDEIIVEGVFTYKGVTLICGIALLYLFVIYLVKYLIDKRGENA